MLHIIFKIIISSGIIAFASEVAKKDSFIAGLTVSIPLTSILSIFWLYLETNNIEKVKALSISIAWMIIPSLIFFISFPILLKYEINFYFSLIASIMITIVIYKYTTIRKYKIIQ